MLEIKVLKQQWTIAVFLFLWHVSKANKEKLLENLWNPYSPWFGLCIYKCQSQRNCFNLRYNSEPESIMARAGFQTYKRLSFELNVTFQAQLELVDVCGEMKELPKVDPFSLHPEGYPNEIDIERGAEIYRQMPRVSWPANPDKRYTLLFYDVGYYKIRGLWRDIQLIDGHLKGKKVTKYTPPANPSEHLNPILILVFEQGDTRNLYRNLIDNCVIYKSGTVDRAESCRRIFRTYFTEDKSMVLKGAQVYFSDGDTAFEKYRACIESLPCDDGCIDSFTKPTGYSVTFGPERHRWGKQMKVRINSIMIGQTDEDVSRPAIDVIFSHFHGIQDNVDHVVSIKFRSKPKVCIDDQTSRFVDVRGIHIEQYAIDERFVDYSNVIQIIIEVGVPSHIFFEKPPLRYTALVVAPYIRKGSTEELLSGEAYIENIIVAEQRQYLIYGTRLCPRNSIGLFYVLLFSHTELPRTRPCCLKKHDWRLDKIPSDFMLRSVATFYVKKTIDEPCADRDNEINNRCDLEPELEILNNSTSDEPRPVDEEVRLITVLPCQITTTTRSTWLTTTNELVTFPLTTPYVTTPPKSPPATPSATLTPPTLGPAPVTTAVVAVTSATEASTPAPTPAPDPTATSIKKSTAALTKKTTKRPSTATISDSDSIEMETIAEQITTATSTGVAYNDILYNMLYINILLYVNY